MNPKYPVGVETFHEIIEEDFIYVDKTEIIYKLANFGKYIFLSRPRRFGKSLTISTLEAYFEGRKDLFDGLWLGSAEGVDWIPRPVLRLNFISSKKDPDDLQAVIHRHLCKWEERYCINDINTSLAQRFYNVIERAYETTGQKVVVLVDEYDKALFNTMDEPEVHEQMRDILKPMFSILKEADRYIHFALLTGVTRFSKLSIFSDLNNIEDISLHPAFATLCGITEDEIRRFLAPGVEAFSRELGTDFEGMMQILKDNYDGYHFARVSPDIYNPYSLILALKNHELAHRWFETGTPSFLLDRLSESNEDIRKLLSTEVSARMLSNTMITESNMTSMLFQTGYLTIKAYDSEEDTFTLGLPNYEVATGMFEGLLPYYTGRDMLANDDILRRLRKAVRNGRTDEFLKTMQSFMAGIPQHLSEGKPEIYYENNLYLILRLVGFDVNTEQQTSDGRIDCVLKTPKYIYVMELKLNGTAEQAMQQLRERKYDRPFDIDGRQIIRIGVSFSKQTRTIDDWIVE